MSNDGGTLPTTEEKAVYEAAKKELTQALNRKRQADKQLVSDRKVYFISNFV